MCPSWSQSLSKRLPPPFTSLCPPTGTIPAGQTWAQHSQFPIPWSTSLGSLVIILPWDRVGRHFHCSQVWNVASRSSGCCIRSVLAHMQAVLHSLAVKFGWCSSRWDISRRWSRYLFSRMKDLYCVYLAFTSHSVPPLGFAILYHFLLNGNCFEQLESFLDHRNFIMPKKKKKSNIMRPPVFHNSNSPYAKTL